MLERILEVAEATGLVASGFSHFVAFLLGNGFKSVADGAAGPATPVSNKINMAGQASHATPVNKMPLTEDQIRLLVRVAQQELGADASPQRLQDVVRQAAETIEREGPKTFAVEPRGKLLVICIGAKSTNLETALSQALRESGCQVLERFQQNLASFHVLLAVLDSSQCEMDFGELRESLAQAGNRLGVKILVQTEVRLER